LPQHPGVALGTRTSCSAAEQIRGLTRQVEVALHEGEVDEGLGIGVAPDLPLTLPELDLLVDVADVEPPFRIDIGQPGRDQRRRLLYRGSQDGEQLLVSRTRHQLAVLALAEGL